MTTVLLTLLAVVVALLVVLVVGLLRSNARLAQVVRERGVGPAEPVAPGAGSTYPTNSVSGITPDGGEVALTLAGPTLFLFLTSTCTTCAALWRAVADAASRDELGSTGLLVVTKGEEAERASHVRRLAPPDVAVVMSSTTWDAYRVERAPHVVLVDGPSGTVLAERAAANWHDVVELAGATVARP